MRISAREVALAALFAALTAAGAQLSIPIGPVPITLQTFFVLLSGLVGGPFVGLLSQLIYLMIGALGLPVFAGFTGSVAVFFGPTAGYLFAFPIASAAAGAIYYKRGRRFVISATLAAIIAEAIIYLIGVPWLAYWLALQRNVGLSETVLTALTLGMLPFLPGDALKAAAAVYVATRRRVREIMLRASYEGRAL